MGRKRKRGSICQASPVEDARNCKETLCYSCCFNANPHLLQNQGGIFRTNESLDRVLSPLSPRLPYRRREQELKSTLHWGQRKLLLSEIEFLTKCNANTETCVYIGAAPGTHIPYLSTLFPQLHFILIDPSPFSIKASDKLTIRREFATPELCAEYRDLNTLFISDIRTADYRIMNSAEVEESIKADMKLQQDCFLSIGAKAGVLKFRLPWSEGSTEYLSGEIHLPIWGPQTTTECRLVISEPILKTRWDHKDYNEKMFYFNSITRASPYEHCITSVRGLDKCYDCTAEVNVLSKYIKKTFLVNNSSDDTDDQKIIASRVRKMMFHINRACSGTVIRDLSNWSCNKVFKKKVFNTANQTVSILVDNKNKVDSILHSKKHSGESICLSAWILNLEGVPIQSSWCSITEDKLIRLAEYHNTGSDKYNGCRFGLYDLGYDVAPEEAIYTWLWSAMLELTGANVMQMLISHGTDEFAACETLKNNSLQYSSTIAQILSNFNFSDLNESQSLPHQNYDEISSNLVVGIAPDNSECSRITENILVFFSSSGCAYIIWISHSPIVTRVVLPTKHLEHATLVYGSIEITKNNCRYCNLKTEKKLAIRAILARNGCTTKPRKLEEISSSQEIRDFIHTELDFQNDAHDGYRKNLFYHSGFTDIICADVQTTVDRDRPKHDSTTR